jgi:transcriptional regulator with XRE-family HTH domain
MSFGGQLATLRRQRRLSQGSLALAAGISQRHLSFLETGRARPGPQALRRIIEALDLTASETSGLMAEAGMRSTREVPCWEDDRLAQVRHIVRRILDRHDPWPALVMDRSGDVLDTNSGFDALIAVASGDGDIWLATCGPKRRNLYDLSFHPEGIVRFLVSRRIVLPHVIRRLKRAAALDTKARQTLQRVCGYPAADVDWIGQDPRDPPETGIVTEDYVFGGLSLRLISTVSSFGGPEDELSQSIIVESFFPADAATETALAGLATRDRPAPEHDQADGHFDMIVAASK